MNQGGGAFTVDPRSGLYYASFGQRAGASLLDGALSFAALIVVTVVRLIVTAIDPTLGAVVGLAMGLAYLAAAIAVLIIGEGGPLGQSPGKHLVGIKVVGPRPGPIGYGTAAVRYLGRLVDSIVCCLPIGVIWPLFDQERRAWHDMVADTRVVEVRSGEQSLGYWLRNFRLSAGGVLPED
jgi:uncharacterized RDD family membrane protein YckC